MAAVHIFGKEYSAPKKYRDGTHRTRSPRDTISAYQPLMPLMGITRLANVTGLDSIGLPVYTAYRPNSRCLAAYQGKGVDADAAKASALMEAIEFWHAEFIDKPLLWDSYQRLKTRVPVVDVHGLPVRKGVRLQTDHPCLWIEGFDLLNEQPCWVPLERISMNFVNAAIRTTAFYNDSTGLASGNHLLEAIIHGLCEVIERDCHSLWQHSDDSRQLDLDTVKDPLCRCTLDRLARAGVHAAAWNLTNDIGVPAYGCMIMDVPDQPHRWRLAAYNDGFGCHLSPEVALLRAITEAVQVRLTVIAGSRDDMLRRNYRHISDNSYLQAIWHEMTNPLFTEDMAVQSSLATPSFEEDLQLLLDRLRAVGVKQVVVVDHTRPEIGIPVATVVVPGLELPGDKIQPGARRHRISSED